MVTTFKLLDVAAFGKLVSKIGKTQAVLTADIQTAAIHAVAHSLLHGNVMPAQNLYGAMGKSLRKDSLVAWLEKYGALAWSKGEKKFLHFKRDDVVFNDDYAELIAGDPWNTAIKQPETVSKYDIDTMFDAFLAKCRKLVKEAEANPKVRVANADLLNVLSSAEASWYDAKAVKEMKQDENVVAEGEKQQAVADAKAAAQQ
jgi:hypothetical protein